MTTIDRIDTRLDEQRSFPPPPAFRAAAHVRDQSPYERAERGRDGFWGLARRHVTWRAR